IEIHYRHYLYYANSFVATAILYLCYRIRLGVPGPWSWVDAGAAALEAILFATSRDTLKKYYARSEQLLGPDRRSTNIPARRVFVGGASTVRQGGQEEASQKRD